MDEHLENAIANKILSSATTFNEKKHFQGHNIAKEKAFCETTDNAHVKLEEIEQHQILNTLDITEMQISEGQNDMINDNVKMEIGITADDTKIEFDNGLLFCEDCHVYCQDYCAECGMLVSILNKNTLNKTDNATKDGLPDDILEIRESLGQLGIFALRVIPKDVKFGPFTGLSSSSSESNWKLKGGKFIVSKDKLKHLNWMQHINPARSIYEENLLPLQRDGNLYYRSTREIHAGEELLVYFGEEYDESLNKNVEMDFIHTAEQDVGDVFACTFCCLGFNSRSILAKHKSICRDNADGKFSVEELMQCPFCNFYLGEQEYSNYHKGYCSEGNVRKSILLEPDNNTIEVKTDRTRRLQMYKCTHCNYKTSYKGDLKIHSNQHYEVKRYKCEACSKRFKTKRYLKMHVEKVHAYYYNCKKCDYKTNNKSHFERHIKTKHLKKFDYYCDSCDFKANDKSHLEVHIKSAHLKEFDYKCEACDFKTNQRSKLKMHIKTKHLKEFDYNCKMCDYKTNERSNMEKHTKTKHLKEFDYNCKICNLRTNKKSDLEKHIKSKHLKEFDYNCEICDYETNKKSHFEMHKKTKHLKQFAHNCEACDFKTNKRADLEKHTKTKHLKEFDYNCEICDYKTNRKSHYEMHNKTKHLKEFDYSCGTCDFKTNSRSHLENHIRSKHLKEFDYNCKICDLKTNNKSQLDEHTKSQHLKEFDYICEICGYKTNRKLYLESHKKAKHL